MWWPRRVCTTPTISHPPFKWRPIFVNSKFSSIDNSNRCLSCVFIDIWNKLLRVSRVRTLGGCCSRDAKRRRCPGYKKLMSISSRKTPVSCGLKDKMRWSAKIKRSLTCSCVRLTSALNDTHRYSATVIDTQPLSATLRRWGGRQYHHISLKSWSI